MVKAWGLKLVELYGTVLTDTNKYHTPQAVDSLDPAFSWNITDSLFHQKTM